MSKKPKPNSNDPTGRIIFDDRGNATWEWRTETGTFSRNIDTVRVRALQDAADVKLSETQPSGTDPYSTADRQPIDEKTSRRTLDDMRKLSETIKQSREKK